MGQKYSYDRGKYWEVALWLIFDAYGGARLTRGEPDLKRDERAMSLTVKVPHALFNVPSLRATMTIEAPTPIVPPIDLTAAADALKQSLGFDIDIQVNQIEPPE